MTQPENTHRLLLALLAVSVLVIAVLLARLLMVGDSPSVEPEGSHVLQQTEASGALAAYDLNGDGMVYQDGMHPQIVRDEPGLCPICGMELTPVPVTGADDGMVRIDPVTVQNIGVRTGRVQYGPLPRSTRTTGEFAVVDGARHVVTLRTEGWIERLYVDQEGQRVRAGQRLLDLYAPDLVATQEEYLLALRTSELLGGGDEAERLVRAARTRLGLFGISDAEITTLGERGTASRALPFHTPATGTVVNHRAVEGMRIPAGTPLMEIVDLRTLWLRIAVPEQDLSWVGPGTRASIALVSDPGSERQGVIDYMYDTLDPATRTVTARLTVPNPGGTLRPGMFATVELRERSSVRRLHVPIDAVIRSGDRSVVLRALGDGKFLPVPVHLGAEVGDRVEVLHGLEEDQAIVTSAQFLIDSEARLAAALTAMMPMPGMQDMQEAPDMQHMDHMPDMPDMEHRDHMPDMPDMEHKDHMPDMEHKDHMPDMEHMDHTPDMEHMEHTPDMEHQPAGGASHDTPPPPPHAHNH